MARLTLPRMNKETGDLVKMSTKLTGTRTYLRDLCSNPRGGDAAIVASLRNADESIELAKTHMATAIREMAEVAKVLERRKAITVK